MLHYFLKKLLVCDYSILLNSEYIDTEDGKPIAKILSKVTLSGLFPAEWPEYFSQCFSYQNCSDFLSKATSGFSGEIAYEQDVFSKNLTACDSAFLHSESLPTILTQFTCNDEKIQSLQMTAGKFIGGVIALGGALYLWQRYRHRQAPNPPAPPILTLNEMRP